MCLLCTHEKLHTYKTGVRSQQLPHPIISKRLNLVFPTYMLNVNIIPIYTTHCWHIGIRSHIAFMCGNRKCTKLPIHTTVESLFFYTSLSFIYTQTLCFIQMFSNTPTSFLPHSLFITNKKGFLFSISQQSK